MKDLNENNNYRYGMFYYNPEDSRLLVKKRNGLGYTLNFAHRLYIGLFVVVILLIIVLAGSRAQ